MLNLKSKSLRKKQQKKTMAIVKEAEKSLAQKKKVVKKIIPYLLDKVRRDVNLSFWSTCKLKKSFLQMPKLNVKRSCKIKNLDELYP